MPEYLAPGVYVEEVSFRQKTIEGVSTSTTGFIGPTRFGPIAGEPELITSFSDFERIYGGIDRLEFEDLGLPMDNYVAHAVRAFFDEGGQRLYVVRTFAFPERDGVFVDPDIYGRARWPAAAGSPEPFLFEARFPGRAGNFTVTLVFRLGENTVRVEPVDPSDTDPAAPTHNVLRGVQPFDTVWAEGAGSPPSAPAGAGTLYWVERFFDEPAGRWTFRLRNDNPANDPPVAPVTLDQVGDVRVLTVSVIVSPLGRFGFEQSWEGLTFHPAHRQSLSRVFDPDPQNASAYLRVPLTFHAQALTHGAEIGGALMEQSNILDATLVADNLTNADLGDASRTFRVRLEDGLDGDRPAPGEYEGDETADGRKSGFLALEDIEEISIVAAPGSTFGLEADYTAEAQTITRQLIAHCERMRYRVAVLDSGDAQTLSNVRTFKAGIDTTRAALYYPWVRVFDPLTEQEIHLPPSGFVSGIYARNDVDRGVHKAPANEVVRLATGFELLLNKAQQDVLNPEGINCLRYFEGRGFRVWGARTASSDPEWKYLNVRRYFVYLERSIEKGTQWAVFENNGPVLWSNVRSTVEDFLLNEFSNNRLLGSKPDEAFFVRCDRTTMTQNDLDNGRLVCLIGVAPLRPAEFVIFRIGQKTADSRA
jgi:phage tail sheath protein FI